MAVGNLIGSNIFNIASVLGLTAMIQPISVDNPQILSSDIFWMMAFSAVLIPLVFIPKRFEIGRYKGLILLVAYAIFIFLAFITFRIFDIFKPYPINIIDKNMKGGLGVVLDDIVAGIYSLMVILIIAEITGWSTF